MFPFDSSFQQQCMADCYSNFAYNCYAPSYSYDLTPYALNYICPNFQNSTLITNHSQYSYIPDYDSSLKDANKFATQTTQGTISEQNLDEEKEDVVKHEQVKMEAESPESEEHKQEQKFGRNIASNIFRNILKCAATEPQFAHLIQAAISTNHFAITYDGFITKLTEKSKILKSYVNRKTIQSLLSGKKVGSTRLDLEFTKILRILSRIYINRYHLLNIFNSGKIRRKSRSLHVKSMRKLLKLFT